MEVDKYTLDKVAFEIFFLCEENLIFLPKQQTDTHRARWHELAEEKGLGHRTIHLWEEYWHCGANGSCEDGYHDLGASDYDASENPCHYDGWRTFRRRVVILFKESMKKEMNQENLDKVKEVFFQKGLIGKTHDGKWALLPSS